MLNQATIDTIRAALEKQRRLLNAEIFTVDRTDAAAQQELADKFKALDAALAELEAMRVESPALDAPDGPQQQPKEG